MSDENKKIAEIIFRQLGGNKFKAMTGAYNLAYDTRCLILHFRGSRKANVLKITLNATDLYDMKFYKFSKKTFETKKVQEYNDIYNDMLQRLFTEFTGLDTHL